MRCSLVSNKIIQARERLGLTQQQLAEKLCVTNKAVSKWECGVTLPDISLLVPLCRVLGLTVQELLDEYDGKFGNTPGCQTTEDPAQDTLFAAQQHSHYLYIDLKTTSTVSPHLFGHNLEHTRASIMDGLSAQMIRNRKFAGAAARNGVALDASANACTLPMNTAFPVATQTKLMYVITRTTACGGVTNASPR